METVDIICPGRAVIILAETEGNSRMISVVSINLLVVYRESVNLIGYLTRRLSAVSKIQLVVYHQCCVVIG